jgi:ABC-type antimicrobial peptide transport system permease subunit
MEAFSRQATVFEKNEYVESVDLLNSSLGDSSKTDFNLNLSLNKKIFSYVAESAENQTPILETATPSFEQPLQESPTETKGSAKLITLFKFLLEPEIVGTINQTDYTIELSVPYGTDITKLAPIVNASTGTAVSPLSGAVQDFTNPVVYKVTAQDGTIQNYIATVKVLPKTAAKASKSAVIAIWVVAISIIVAAIIVAVFLFINKKQKAKEQTNAS